MIERVIPAWSWLRAYRRGDLRADVLAGAGVAVMLVPQAMAYALLAGLPPVAGLYAATLPLAIYALFGTSRHLAVGPVAVVSLLTAAACAGLGAPGSPERLAAAGLLALLAGLLQVALGLARAGFLVNFVSRAVVGGFTSAAAILIGLSQAGHLLGIELAASGTPAAVAWEAARRAGEAHGLTLAIGLAVLLALWLARRLRSRFPAALPAVAAATLLVWALGLDRLGVRTVGAVPGGFPVLSWPGVSLTAAAGLAPAAAGIVLLGFMESIAVAQWIAAREKYRVEPNRELIGLGLANLAAGLVSGYPVTGGFSRTAVNYQAGARTPLASVVTAGLVLLSLLALTPLFACLPTAALSAVIVSAVAGLVDLREAARLFRIKRGDGWIFLATFLTTLGLGVSRGLVAGILLSLLLFVARSSRPRTVVLGRLAGRNEYRDLARHPEAETFPDLILIRVDASLYFANARFVEDRVLERLALQPAARWVVMDMSGVNDIDAAAVMTLDALMEACAARGVGFAFAGIKAQVRAVAERAGWVQRLGARLDYPGLEAARLALARDAAS